MARIMRPKIERYNASIYMNEQQKKWFDEFKLKYQEQQFIELSNTQFIVLALKKLEEHFNEK